jgi:AcrR family transcriptional regulator
VAVVNEHDADDLGWRERKKLATRDAIGAAALRLALQRGPENVRVEDIATAAGVSPRTFNNYFSSREEAIFALRNARTRGLAAVLRSRPAEERLDEALTAAILAVQDTEPDKAGIRLAAATPAMRAEFLRLSAASEIALAEVIAERTGGDLTVDPGPRVVAAAFTAAIRIAGEYWLRSDDATPFSDILRNALDRVSPVARTYSAPNPSANPLPESSAC